MALKGIGNPSAEPCTSQDDPFAIHDDPGTEILFYPIRSDLPMSFSFFLLSSFFVQIRLIRFKARDTLETTT